MLKLELITTAKLVNENETCEIYKIGLYEVEIYLTKAGLHKIRRFLFRKDYNANYLPSIYFTERRYGEEINKFEIQTVSYGALDAEEIQKVIKGYEQALEVVAILTKEFLN